MASLDTVNPIVAIEQIQTETKWFDVKFYSQRTTDLGWKLSIQGKSVDDAIFLFETLHPYLVTNDIAFKVGTIKRVGLINSADPALKMQGFKLMTIYCPDDLDVNALANDIYNLIPQYKGWYDVKTPLLYAHFAGGVFIRKDTDEDGNYLSAIDQMRLQNL